MPPPTVIVGVIGGGVAKKVVVNGPEPDGIVNVWP